MSPRIARMHVQLVEVHQAWLIGVLCTALSHQLCGRLKCIDHYGRLSEKLRVDYVPCDEFTFGQCSSLVHCQALLTILACPLLHLQVLVQCGKLESIAEEEGTPRPWR